MHHIEEVSEIAEELLFRFSADLIFLDPMLETEIQERIISIHKALELTVRSASEAARLAARAVESGRQYRRIEAYLSRLIAKHPDVLERNGRPSNRNDSSAEESII